MFMNSALDYRTIRVSMKMCILVHIDLKNVENWLPAVHTILPMILTAYIHMHC
jgi:hypothetical protein